MGGAGCRRVCFSYKKQTLGGGVCFRKEKQTPKGGGGGGAGEFVFPTTNKLWVERFVFSTENKLWEEGFVFRRRNKLRGGGGAGEFVGGGGGEENKLTSLKLRFDEFVSAAYKQTPTRWVCFSGGKTNSSGRSLFV